MQAAEHVHDAVAKVLHDIAVHQQMACLSQANIFKLTAEPKPINQAGGLVRCNAGSAHKISRTKSSRAAKPGQYERSLFRSATPELLDPVLHIHMTTAN